MQIKAPRLLINRHGVYYFRYKSEGVEKRISLRTKCSNTANIIALQLNLNIERKRAMTNPKLSDFDFGSLGRYELTLPNGMKIKTDGTQEDHSRALEALDQIGPLLQNMPSAQIVQQPAPSLPKSEALIAAVKKWLANCAGKNGPRTVVTKTYHIKDFMARSFSHVESVEHWLAESQNTDFLKERSLRTVEARKVRGDYMAKDVESIAISKKTLTDYKGSLASGPTPKPPRLSIISWTPSRTSLTTPLDTASTRSLRTIPFKACTSTPRRPARPARNRSSLSLSRLCRLCLSPRPTLLA